jgi:hypothetical protein
VWPRSGSAENAGRREADIGHTLRMLPPSGDGLSLSLAIAAGAAHIVPETALSSDSRPSLAIVTPPEGER